ncbi:MAG: ATP-binding protein [Clostridiales Family XIII bacterium]|jgi:energy-coupling factor transporter ATP-binding protein EcfA2|nr:ATP-binding protein [Clostridiales Family XIII bacterium]
MPEAKVFITNITFNDGTPLKLTHNSIVVFTGANNCGKSQVLRDIEHLISKENQSYVIAKELMVDTEGALSDEFLSQGFNMVDGFYHCKGALCTKDNLDNMWNSKELQQLHQLFINRLDTRQRLGASKSTVLGDPSVMIHSPLYKVFQDNEFERTISTLFKEAFDIPLAMNRRNGDSISLHVGTAPDRTSYTMEQEFEYYKELSALPVLDEQGDGMIAFANILLDTFKSEYSVTLIDEPEAFLHPPQARMLGKTLSKTHSNERQLFISTHSVDFLQGLLDVKNENLTIIRIERSGNTNPIRKLENTKVRELWSNPLLRYSNILSGLFHKKVVVCESDYDCLLYHAVMDSIFENRNEISPDILFVHCGGKGRMATVVEALRALSVPVMAIPDFDIINNKREFRPLVEAFDIVWDDQIDEAMKTIYDWLNADESKKEGIKRGGKSVLDGDAPAKYELVESICAQAGLFIVPVGEMECFDKTVYKKEKKEWVYEIISRENLCDDPKLSKLREFIQAVIDC